MWAGILEFLNNLFKLLWRYLEKASEEELARLAEQDRLRKAEKSREQELSDLNADLNKIEGK